MATLQRKSLISEITPEDSSSVVAGIARMDLGNLANLKTLQRPTLVDDEIERLIDLAYAHARNQSVEGWNNMWKAVLGRLFPSDRYDITTETRNFKWWKISFLFVTRKQDSRKVLMAFCSCPVSRKDKAGCLNKRTLVLSYLKLGKKVEDEPMYCLGLVGTDFSWGLMENGVIEGIDPKIEWDDFDLGGSHGSLHQLAEYVGRL